MKKIILILALIVSAITTNAQITFEHTYKDVSYANLSNSGYKYFTKDKTANQIKLYNINHSFWKTINIAVPSGHIWTSGGYVSQNLFNADNFIEVVYTTSNGPDDSVFVMNENGNIIFRIKGSYAYIQNFGSTNFKLWVEHYNGPNYDSTSIYSLPGTLPCDPCSGVGIVEQGSDSRNMLSNAYPNPTSGRVTINYELPEGVNQGKLVFYNTTGEMVKEFIVDKTFKELQISNEDLSSGTYYYQMQTKSGVSEGKKLVIIK